jgi:hypothetical protein
MVADQQQSRRHATAAEIEGGAKGETEENEENWQATALSKGRAGQGSRYRAGQGRTGQGGGFCRERVGCHGALTVRGTGAKV